MASMTFYDFITFVMDSAPSKVRNRATAQHHQTICAVLSHFAHFQHSKFNAVTVYAYRIALLTLVCLHGCAVACA